MASVDCRAQPQTSATDTFREGSGDIFPSSPEDRYEVARKAGRAATRKWRQRLEPPPGEPSLTRDWNANVSHYVAGLRDGLEVAFPEFRWFADVRERTLYPATKPPEAPRLARTDVGTPVPPLHDFLAHARRETKVDPTGRYSRREETPSVARGEPED